MQHRSVYNSFHAFFTDLPEPVSYRQLKRKMNLMKNQETQRLYLKYQIRKEQRVVRAKVYHKFNYCSTRSFELSQTGIPRINSGHCESSFWCRANQHSNSQIQITNHISYQGTTSSSIYLFQEQSQSECCINRVDKYKNFLLNKLKL